MLCWPPTDGRCPICNAFPPNGQKPCEVPQAKHCPNAPPAYKQKSTKSAAQLRHEEFMGYDPDLDMVLD
jgi:hypothetical protein